GLRTASAFRALRPRLGPPSIRKSSRRPPRLSSAASQRGGRPRPVQGSLGFSGLRDFGATRPRGPLPPIFGGLPRTERFFSLDSSSLRAPAILAFSSASTLSRSSIRRSRLIDFNCIFGCSASAKVDDVAYVVQGLLQ